MKLPKELKTVTPLSKFVALSLFVILPVLAFFIGRNYPYDTPTPSPILILTPTPSISITPSPERPSHAGY